MLRTYGHLCNLRNIIINFLKNKESNYDSNIIIIIIYYMLWTSKAPKAHKQKLEKRCDDYM